MLVPSPSDGSDTNSSSNLATIAGGAAGGVVALIVLVLAAIWLYKFSTTNRAAKVKLFFIL